MALNQQALYFALNTRIFNELLRYQKECAIQTSSDFSVFQALVAAHAGNLAKIIAEEVDTFVRSADIKPERFAIQENSIMVVGNQWTQNGPYAGNVPLQKDVITLDDMNS